MVPWPPTDRQTPHPGPRPRPRRRRARPPPSSPCPPPSSPPCAPRTGASGPRRTAGASAGCRGTGCTTPPRTPRPYGPSSPPRPGPSYGIACGRAPHRLIGIDLDVDPAYGSDAAYSLRQLALQHLFTIPPTVTVLTPSGGRHLWLTGPADATVPNSAGRLAPGIDIRGYGGYLVGPGSVTAHGRYRLAPGTAHLAPAPCPRALLRLLTQPRRPPTATRSTGPAPDRRGEGLIQFVLAAHEGQRNTRLFWAACRAYEHGFGNALADALTAAAVRTGLPEHEARATIASAARLTTGRNGETNDAA